MEGSSGSHWQQPPECQKLYVFYTDQSLMSISHSPPTVQSLVISTYPRTRIPAFYTYRWTSYFRADHSIVLSVYPFGELFLCRPSLGKSYFRADHLILHPLMSYFNVYHIILHPSISLASYFRADHLTFHPSILLASYFCVVHPLGELFSCLPINSPSFGELFFVPII